MGNFSKMISKGKIFMIIWTVWLEVSINKCYRYQIGKGYGYLLARFNFQNLASLPPLSHKLTNVTCITTFPQAIGFDNKYLLLEILSLD